MKHTDPISPSPAEHVPSISMEVRRCPGCGRSISAPPVNPDATPDAKGHWTTMPMWCRGCGGSAPFAAEPASTVAHPAIDTITGRN